MLPRGHFPQWHFPDFSFKIFIIICFKYPDQMQEGIEKPKIILLVFMQSQFLLCGCEPKPWACLNVIIYAVNVSVSMMDNVVLHIPHNGAASQEIERGAGRFIHKLIFTEATMRSIVHYVKPDGCS